ncbi:hypothetical protein ASG76_14955 [Nocardioides sp. Soil774]|uniref:hypothetical protein n=1 Tax=Nocardioides sp. Soil774 TaxID=1736408 RepID=UPI0006F4693B|nr:hypothetical protein [Nocardioides sp. Soil774]KRE92769.1 hypothetical protein ASG76_14955 [Nocardioides sp. Soil774]
MTDFESRLRDTLLERAGAPAPAVGLADGARRRLRRRRTTWAVAAAAVLAAAVPVGLTALGPGTDGSGGVADGGTASRAVGAGDGYRAESWHDLTLEVPADWGYGGVTDWCMGSGAPADRSGVVRPDTLAIAIACTPAQGYGVTIGSSATYDPVVESGAVWQYDTDGVDQAMYPDGAWLGVWYGADLVVTVVTPDRETTRRVVDSVHRFDGADPNGCPAMLGEAEAMKGTGGVDALSLCRYGPDDQLTASRRVVGPDLEAADTAIFSSPRKTVEVDCPTELDLSRIALLRQGAYVATAVTGADCDGWNGLFVSGTERELTPEALRVLDLDRLP